MFYSYAIHSDQYIIIVWQVLYQQFPFDIWPLLQLVAWFKGNTLNLLILQWLGFTENHLPMEKVSKKQPQLLVFMFLCNCQIKSLSRDCCLRSVPYSTSCRNMTARRESEKSRLDLGRLLYLLVRTTTVTCSKHVAFLGQPSENHHRTTKTSTWGSNSHRSTTKRLQLFASGSALWPTTYPSVTEELLVLVS